MVRARDLVTLTGAVLALAGCKLFSLSDGCGANGQYCIYDGGGTSTGGVTGGTTTGGGTGGNTTGTTGGAPMAPGAPTQVVATAAKKSAVITWTAAPSNGSPITSYVVTASAGGGVVDAGSATTATVDALTPGTNYSFSVVASNAIGSGPAGVSNAVVPFDVPAAPLNVNAMAGQSSASVTWTAPAANFSPITAYTVTASPGSQTVTTDGNTTTATVTGLTDYTTYSFSVTATNAAGVSLPGSSNSVTPFVVVTTLSGNGVPAWADGSGGPSGSAEFNYPFSVAVDSQGYVYVADSANNRVRKISPDGTTLTLAGDGDAGYFDGTGGPNGSSQFWSPFGVAVDSQGIVYVADEVNSRVRQVAPDGTTTTLAGDGDAGYFDGTGGPTGTTQFLTPVGNSVDTHGNLYVADLSNNRIRKVATADGTTTTLAGNGDAGYFDGTGGPDGTTSFLAPFGTAVDLQGNVYVADYANQRIRKVAPDGSTTTLSGNGDAGFSDGTGGPTGTAAFLYPTGVAVDTHGNVYVADIGNNRVRKVLPDGTTTTLAGDGDAGYLDGTGGPDGTAQFNGPSGVAVDALGAVYVADYANARIRKIIQ